MPRLPSSARAALAAALFVAAPLAARAGAHWVCALGDDGTRLVCMADALPLPVADANPPATTAVVNGTRFPLDARRIYTVDMFTQPTELDWVLLLARSTMCYRTPDCEVTMAPSPWLRETVARAGAARR